MVSEHCNFRDKVFDLFEGVYTLTNGVTVCVTVIYTCMWVEVSTGRIYCPYE